MNFLKNILATVLGIWVSLVIVVFVIIGVVATVASKSVVEVKENTILEINISSPLKDYVSDEQDVFLKAFGVDEQIGFNQIISAIQKVKHDENIQAVSIKKLPQNMGWSQLTTLRKELQSLKQFGKKVWAYGDFYTQRGYYLSSVADSLFMSPIGRVELKGLHSEVMFYKSLQEKYGIKMEVIRHGKYKSAVEPFIADEMSEENRHQISELIYSIWGEVKNAIEKDRNIDADEAVYNLQGKLPSLALENNLVDELLYEDDYNKRLKKTVADKTKIITLGRYIQSDLSSFTASKKDEIAVVYAQGSIIYGEGDENNIGQKLMQKTIAKAAKNKKIKAIVLRVNSPGGSALASDLIWNAIEKAKEKKPVVVSMGNLAASGGYYISCNADYVYAESTTITGSIGVFGMLPNASTLAQKNGINAEVVSSHNNGAYYSVVKPITSQFKGAVKDGIEHIYDVFINRVATGRNMTLGEVNAVAQGRVWTGIQAQEIGLVDEIGSLQDAIAYAANLVELTDYSIRELPKYEMDFTNILGKTPFMKYSSASVFGHKLMNDFKNVQEMFSTTETQARLPFELMVE